MITTREEALLSIWNRRGRREVRMYIYRVRKRRGLEMACTINDVGESYGSRSCLLWLLPLLRERDEVFVFPLFLSILGNGVPLVQRHVCVLLWLVVALFHEIVKHIGEKGCVLRRFKISIGGHQKDICLVIVSGSCKKLKLVLGRSRKLEIRELELQNDLTLTWMRLTYEAGVFVRNRGLRS